MHSAKTYAPASPSSWNNVKRMTRSAVLSCGAQVAISWVAAMSKASSNRTKPWRPAERKATVRRGLHSLHYTIFRMRKMPKPVICAVEGAAAGFGVPLAAAGDLTIAAESAFFTLAYARIGLSPDGSSTYFLPRMIGLKRTFEMMYLADRYTAEEAKEMGLVTRVVPNDEFDNHVSELAAKLADGPTYAYGRGKALLNTSFENSMESQVELETYAITDCMMTDDHIEGITAFVDKRAPIFKGK